MNFSKLTLENISQIGNLLMSVYSLPENFGTIGCPVFSEDYLHWIFGGPNKDKHILVGAMMNDELVAYQSFLYRRIYYCGEYLNAYLNTHGVISPQLDYRLRLNCGFQLVRQHALFLEESEFYEPNCDLVYAFFDVSRPTKEVLDKLVKKYFKRERNIHSVFHSFIVMPNRLRMYTKENTDKLKPFQVRTASADDSKQLINLFNRVPSTIPFIMLVTEDELKHHFFSHPARRTFVVESQGVIKGFINFYPLEMFKEGKTSVYIIIEFLISESDNKDYIAALLQEAVNCAENIKAKVITFENATYLDYTTCRILGIVPTLRKMAMTILSKKHLADYGGGFRCDVK